MSGLYMSARTNCSYTMCRHINWVFWRGTFWLHKETVAFKGPAA